MSQSSTRADVKLDVKEIHGYDAAVGLELLKPEALAWFGARARPGHRT